MIQSTTNTIRKTFEYILPPLTLAITGIALYQISLQSRSFEEKARISAGVAFLGTLALCTNKSVQEIFKKTIGQKIASFFSPPNPKPIEAITEKLLEISEHRVQNNPALTEFYEKLQSLQTQQQAIARKRSFYQSYEQSYYLDDEDIVKRSKTIGRMYQELASLEDLLLQMLKKLDSSALCGEEKIFLSTLISKRQVHEKNHETLGCDEIAQLLSMQTKRAEKQADAEPSRTFSYQICPTNSRLSEAREIFDYTSTTIGTNIAVCEAQGRRPNMEDATLAIQLHIDTPERTYKLPLFGVFDGHAGVNTGYESLKASDYVKKMLPAKLKEKIEYFLSKCSTNTLTDKVLYNALKHSLVELHEEYPGLHGTTVNIGLMANNAIYAANIGDSRSIFIDNKDMQLTEDAKPNDPRHKKIINALGAQVLFQGNSWRTNGILGMGSALGDPNISGVNPTVDITKTSISPKGGIYLAACDGLWDAISSKNACKILREHKQSSAEDLAKNMLYSAWKAGSEDNLSAIVVKIPETTTL